MMNYPSPSDKLIVRASDLADLRAWRVYGPMLTAFQQEHHASMEEIFLCEDVGADVHGPRRRVFTCSACRKEACQDPLKYDLFDGHSPNGHGGWQYEPNGVGEPIPDALGSLTSEERLALGIVKMADAA